MDDLPDNVSVGIATLRQLSCVSSTYTYFDCLQDGYDWYFCKRTYPMQPIAPHSELTVSVPASGPLGVNGTITLEGGLRYREVTRTWGISHLGCFVLDEIAVTGFTGLQNSVIAQVGQLFDANGELCLSTP